MSPALAVSPVAPVPAAFALPADVDAGILAAVHQDAAATEHGAVSRAKLKDSAALIDSIDHLRRLCVPDMKACFDHPDRPGSTMVQRRQEAWEAIGRYLCVFLGLAGMHIKVRALNYAGHYEVVLEEKTPVDGLREVIKTAQRYGVFVASEVEHMYADKQRGGMMFGTYHNHAPAANDACAADEAADCAYEADALPSLVDGQAPLAAAEMRSLQDDAASDDVVSTMAAQAVAALPDQASILMAIDLPAPVCEAAELPVCPAAPMEESDSSAPSVPVKTRAVRMHRAPTRTITLDVDPARYQAFLDVAGAVRSRRGMPNVAQGAVAAHASTPRNLPEPGEVSRLEQSHGTGTSAPSRPMTRHRGTEAASANVPEPGDVNCGNRFHGSVRVVPPQAIFQSPAAGTLHNAN